MTERLRVDALSHAYDAAAVLDAVSLAVAEGEILCLLGPSGCGKTTLLRLVAGLERLQAGTIAIGGKPVAGGGAAVPPEQRGVGMLFQDFALFPHLSVVDNVSFGVTAPERRVRALDLLGRLGMADYAAAFPHTLSGGQQQRVALARALAPRPLLMLLDEPFSGIDARLRGVLRDETLHLLKGSGVATVMVTHDAEEAMFMADRIAVMRAGRIVQVGAPAELYRRPASAFVAEFFGEVNRIPATVVGGAVPTPFGTVPAGALADGARAEVLIRPESLIPVAGDQLGAVPGRVIAARMLGRTTLIHLEVAGADGALHLHARVRGDLSFQENAPIWLELDRGAAVVLPFSYEDDDTTR